MAGTARVALAIGSVIFYAGPCSSFTPVPSLAAGRSGVLRSAARGAEGRTAQLSWRAAGRSTRGLLGLRASGGLPQNDNDNFFRYNTVIRIAGNRCCVEILACRRRVVRGVASAPDCTVIGRREAACCGRAYT